MGAALPGCRMDTGMPPGSRNRSPTASQSRHSSLLGARSLRSSVTLACNAPHGCYSCAAVATPFTLGVLRPRIYMPQSLQGPPRRAVLLHERTHIRRGDPITKPLYYLAACLHWWNPLAWLAFRQFEEYMELACDEAAIGTAPAAERADYCESILRFATVRQMPGALAFGQGQVAKRVAHLLKYRKPAPLLLALGCVLVALGCGACALRPQAETITPQAEPVSAAAEPTPEPATPADDTLTNSAAEPTAQPEQPQATAEPLVFGWPVADFHYIARFVSDYHRGADYSATKGTPVLAVYGGTVAVANCIHPSYGNHVVIDHGTLPDGHSYRTLYAHMDTLSVAVGDTVTQGQQLGTVGSTGASTGNHLHLELFVDGALTDTRTMIPYDNTTSPDLHLTTTLDFICPLESYTAISAPFRTDDSDTPPHLGVDFAAAGGTPVQAAQSGVVTQAGWDDDHGYFVAIYRGANAAADDDGTYPANYATSYAHLQSKPAVQVGQRVAQGDVIGYVGSTGSSTGNHLHFQLLVNGTPVDPLAMLPQSGKPNETENILCTGCCSGGGSPAFFVPMPRPGSGFRCLAGSGERGAARI